jgi:hypothetical protein
LINDPTTSYLACDITIWVDAQRERQPHNDEFVICQTFDEGVLLNTIWNDPGESINLVPDASFVELDGVLDHHANDCYGNEHFVASRDIQAGEQFRISYDNSSGENTMKWWRALGMG